MSGRGLALAVCGDRKRRDVGSLTRGRIVAAQATAEARAVDDIGIVRIGNIVVAFIGANRMPITIADRAVVASARNGHAAAVLLSGINVVRETLIGCQVIELSRRLVVPARPGQAAVDSDGGALVARRGHVIGMQRIDPQEVIVIAAGSTLDDLAVPAAIATAAERLADGVHHVRIVGRDRDAAGVIAGERLFVVDPLPGGPAIIRAIQAAGFFRVHGGVDPQSVVGSRRGDADAAQRPRGPARSRKPGPAHAAILR